MYVSKNFKLSLYNTMIQEYDKIFQIKLHYGWCDETEILAIIENLKESWKTISVARHERDWCNKFLGYVRRIQIEQDLLSGQYRPVIKLVCITKRELSVDEINWKLKLATINRWQTATKNKSAESEVTHIGIEDYKKTVQSIFKKKTFIETKYLENIRSVSFCGIFNKQNRTQKIQMIKEEKNAEV